MSAYLVIAFTTLSCAAPDEMTIIEPTQGQRLAGDALIIRVQTSSPSARPYVTAVLTYPGGAIERIGLKDDGTDAADVPGDGVFVHQMPLPPIPGGYSLSAKLWDGKREQWATRVQFAVAGKSGELPRKTVWWPWPVLALGLIIGLWRFRRSAPVVHDDGDEKMLKIMKRSQVLLEALHEEVRAKRPDGVESEEQVWHRVREWIEKDLRERREELAGYQHELAAWREMSIEYLDALDRAVEQYGPDDPRGSALSRDASIFARYCAGRGLERITAAPGDPLVPGLFQVVEIVDHEGISEGTIAECVAPGYRQGTEVYRRALVKIAGAATGNGQSGAMPSQA